MVRLPAALPSTYIRSDASSITSVLLSSGNAFILTYDRQLIYVYIQPATMKFCQYAVVALGRPEYVVVSSTLLFVTRILMLGSSVTGQARSSAFNHSLSRV